MDIRAVAIADLDALFAYLGDQLDENGRNGMPLFQPMSRAVTGVPDAMRARFTAGLATKLGEPGWRRAWIAVDAGGAIAGHVDLRGRADPESAHRAILGMGVHRDHRRAGLGARLVEAAVAWARETPPLAWIDLDVLSANHAARALYARTGFVQTGEIEDLYRIDGESHGSVMMSRRL
ncbi:GNAT family N-acetyltransferase [Massilia niastensis]|uniref:GNAT family N-acetyltransferase n=1 Tax=Massilia niastensis TaxID=544911 RepID=UPI00036B08FE|nr:GNAT family N-acetyltransferase [Massilia niastensis]